MKKKISQGQWEIVDYSDKIKENIPIYESKRGLQQVLKKVKEQYKEIPLKILRQQTDPNVQKGVKVEVANFDWPQRTFYNFLVK